MHFLQARHPTVRRDLPPLKMPAHPPQKIFTQKIPANIAASNHPHRPPNKIVVLLQAESTSMAGSKRPQKSILLRLPLTKWHEQQRKLGKLEPTHPSHLHENKKRGGGSNVQRKAAHSGLLSIQRDSSSVGSRTRSTIGSGGEVMRPDDDSGGYSVERQNVHPPSYWTVPPTLPPPYPALLLHDDGKANKRELKTEGFLLIRPTKERPSMRPASPPAHRSMRRFTHDLRHLLLESQSRVARLEEALLQPDPTPKPPPPSPRATTPDHSGCRAWPQLKDSGTQVAPPPAGVCVSVQTGVEESNAEARQSRRRRGESDEGERKQWEIWSVVGEDGDAGGEMDEVGDDGSRRARLRWGDDEEWELDHDWREDESSLDDGGGAWWDEGSVGGASTVVEVEVDPTGTPDEARERARNRIPYVVEVAVPAFRKFDWEEFEDVMEEVDDVGGDEVVVGVKANDSEEEETIFDYELRRRNGWVHRPTRIATGSVLVKPAMRDYVERVIRERVVVPEPPLVEECVWRSLRVTQKRDDDVEVAFGHERTSSKPGPHILHQNDSNLKQPPPPSRWRSQPGRVLQFLGN